MTHGFCVIVLDAVPVVCSNFLVSNNLVLKEVCHRSVLQRFDHGVGKRQACWAGYRRLQAHKFANVRVKDFT